MRDHFEQFRARGADVLTITFATPEMLRLFIDEGRYPFPVLADPDHAAYRAFGLERATWRRILSPRVLLGYLGLMLRGWAQVVADPARITCNSAATSSSTRPVDSSSPFAAQSRPTAPL